MSKKGLTLNTVCLILCILVSINLLGIKSVASDETRILSVNDVNSSQNFINISDAIKYANSEDIIYVEPGLYHESLVINKSISLVSNNSDLTIIDADQGFYSVLIKSSNVTISGFTIKNSTIGVYVNGDNNSIENNFIVNNTNGIFLENSSKNNLVTGNTIAKNLEAIHLYASSFNIILDNYIFNNSYSGIKIVESSTNNKIENNTISENGMGIFLSRWSNYNEIINNNVSQGLYSRGIYLDYSCYNIISYNLLSNLSSGLSLINAQNNIVKNNTFENNYHGVYLKNADEENISGYNFFKENNLDIKYSSKPPSIKLPSSETIIIIIVAFALLVFFFILPKKRD